LPLVDVALAVCVPEECTDISTAAKESATSSVSYVQSGNGHWYLGIVVLGESRFLPWFEVRLPYFPGFVKIQDGRRVVSST